MAEHTLTLGAENHLVATLTPATQTQAEGPPCVAILTNSGVIPRSGPHRMNVHLARRFAAMGIPSVRFDLSGLGDSQRPSNPQALMKQWVSDTRAVMDLAESHFKCARFVMVGFCSGAEVAHWVGLEDARLRAAVLWDLYAYPTAESRIRSLMYRLRRAGPKGLLMKAWRIVRRAGPSSSSPAGTAPAAPAAPSQAPAADEFAARIQTLVDRDVELLFAFADGHHEWFNHAGQFRGMFRRYGFVDKVAFTLLDQCDHLLTRREAQLAFTDMTVQWLQQRVLIHKAPDSSRLASVR